MKRVFILLGIVVVLAWIGSKITPRTDNTNTEIKPNISAQQEDKIGGQNDTSTESEPVLSATEKKLQQEKWFGSETIIAAKRAVKNELKDPDSAQFKDVRANYTEEFNVVACGQVNAKNEFGGYTGFRRFVSSGQSVILEGRDNITDAWSKACL